ncbi:MAG: chemotaxis protein CheB [Acidobacteria bacterium]|nr:MAG: chemotaxis protein CheB [Acidobacteriota bacterium]
MNHKIVPSFCGFDAVVIAGSAGSTDGLLQILERLPAEFPAALLINQHFTSPRLFYPFGGTSQIPVHLTIEQAPIIGGHAYIAPFNYEMIVTHDYKVECSPLKLGYIPSGDALFRSVAEIYGSRAIGVVLSGAGRDCSEGVIELKRRGAKVLVQEGAVSIGMPRAALATGCVDFALPIQSLISALISLVMVEGVAEIFQVALPSWAH